MGISVIFILWLLGIMILWAFTYKSGCGRVFSFLLGRFLGVELPVCMIRLIFKETDKSFYKGAVIWHPYQQYIRVLLLQMTDEVCPFICLLFMCLFLVTCLFTFFFSFLLFFFSFLNWLIHLFLIELQEFFMYSDYRELRSELIFELSLWVLLTKDLGKYLTSAGYDDNRNFWECELYVFYLQQLKYICEYIQRRNSNRHTVRFCYQLVILHHMEVNEIPSSGLTKQSLCFGLAIPPSSLDISWR